MPMPALEISILKTLAYFSVSQMPLTREELYRFLWQAPPGLSYEKFLIELDRLLTENHLPISEESGFIFPEGKKYFIAHRQLLNVPVEKKIRLARRAGRLIRAVPFVRAIFVCNSVAAGGAKPESDIDFFIITAPKRIWLTRFITNVVLFLSGRRRHGRRVTDRICLSFYVDLDHLPMANLRVSDDDVYLAHWLFQLLPIYDPMNFQRELARQNGWVKEFLPRAYEETVDWNAPAGKPSRVQRIGELFWRGAYGDLMERQAEKLQREKIKFSSHGKTRQTKTGVVLEQGILKFHEEDKREEYREKWVEEFDKISNLPNI